MERTLVLAGVPTVLTADDDDHYLRTLASDGPTDLEAVFRSFCSPGDDFVDIGANIGVTAILAAHLVSPGRVAAVEPVPSTFRYLQSNVEGSGLKNVTCLQLAVASNSGQVTLVSRPGFGFAAYVGHAEGLEEYVDYPAISLPLDTLVADLGLKRLRFVKIDVEGYELEVLRGARQVLETFKPVVILESNPYCLSIFHKVSLVDFVAEVLSIFPIVFGLDMNWPGSVVDLTDARNLPGFYHASVVSNHYPNLVCGFEADIGDRLHGIRESITDPSPRDPAVTEPSSEATDGESMVVSARERQWILRKRLIANRLRTRLARPSHR